MGGVMDGQVYHFRIGKPDGYAVKGNPGWRIGAGVSNTLIAEGSAHSAHVGIALLVALTNGSLGDGL